MKFSIIIPVHNMPNKDFFLKRCLDSIEKQTFTDYIVTIMELGSFAENCNDGIREAKGNLIKFLCMDDWLADENSLQRIADNFKQGWLITGCSDNPHPYWTDNIWAGNNKLGSPSCLTIENRHPLTFDDTLKWMVDTEYYMQLYKRYGLPTILDEINVGIGIHPGQMTYQIPDEVKIKELEIMRQRYE